MSEILNFGSAFGIVALLVSFVWLVGFVIYSQRKEKKQDDARIRRNFEKANRILNSKDYE